jgi:hypothetical protein
MPLPPVYSPALQPQAWWAGAQSQIQGLPDLPAAGGSAADMSSYWQSLEPYRPKLMDLYQQSFQNPAAGTTPGDGGVPTATLPTEAGNTALGQLLASFAGASRYGTSPLAGLPSQIGETSYSYAAPTVVGTGGTILGTPNPISWSDLAATNAPAAAPAGSQPLTMPTSKPGDYPVGPPPRSALYGTTPTTGASGAGDPGYAAAGYGVPANPTEGQEWTDANGVTYVYTGGYWMAR